MSLHIEYCEGFGISKKEIEATVESQGKICCLLCLLNITLTTGFSLHCIHKVMEALPQVAIGTDHI